MISDEVTPNKLQNLPTQSFEVNRSFSVVFEFMEKYIPEFIKDPKNYTILNEKGLTQSLVRKISKFLVQENNDIKRNYPFRFDKEGMQDESKGNSASVDLDVLSNKPIEINGYFYSNEEAFFSFEAKILGVNKDAEKREKEYLIGRFEEQKNKYNECGGIERFKASKHGRKLLCSGMIAFVLKDTFENWFKKINTWIDEFARGENLPKGCRCTEWSENEKLQEVFLQNPNQRLRKYDSSHQRQKKEGTISDRIPMTHYWIDLTVSDFSNAIIQ